MKKKKSFISLVLAFCLIIPAMFLLTACGGNKTQTLKSDDGIAVVGEFEKGAELKTDKVEVSSDDATTILGKLESNSIKVTSTSNAMIYDIFVSKDDKKVQPNGKVTVSVPVTESANGYKVFHIKDDNTIEELSATYKDGTLTFETESFSYFVIVPTGDVLMNTDSGTNNSIVAGTIGEWNAVKTYYSEQTNVKVSCRYANDDDPPQSGAQIMIYQYNGTAYSEDGYFENELSSQLYKGKIFYLVKDGNTYRRVEWQDNGGDDNFELVISEDGAEDSYNWAVENEIFGRLDDYNFSEFVYNESEKTYTKTETGKSIIIAFTFENNIVTEIKIKEVETGREVTAIITFGNAEVNLPAEYVTKQS